MGTESYKHQFAKAVLAQWFREVATEKDSSAGLNPISWRVNRSAPHR